MPHQPLFPSTRWTLLDEATLDGNRSGQLALDQLCARYRPPVITFLLNRGWSGPDADDLAQDLFAQLLQSKAWKRADKTKGRFRNYLLTILRHIVSSQRTHANAQKNGGGVPRVSLDQLGEDFDWEPAAAGLEPSAEFDHAWALQMLKRAFERVEERWRENGRGREFGVYRQFLPGSQVTPSYEQVCAELGNKEGAARAAVSRLRSELGEALKQEVALTVSAAEEVPDEMAYLRSVLSRPGLPLGK